MRFGLGVFGAFVFLLLVASSMASSSFQVSGEASAGDFLIVLYPKQDVFKLDSAGDQFSFRVLNGSGWPLDNVSSSCYYHLFGLDHSEISKGSCGFDSSLGLLPGSFVMPVELNATGRYAYNIWCNSSAGQAGWLEGFYDVSVTGIVEDSSDRVFAGVLAFLPLFFGLILLFAAWSLSGEDHPVIKVFLFLLSFPLFFISLYFGGLAVVKFYDWPELQDAIGSVIFWFSIVWVVIVAYFIIYGIKEAIRQAAEEKDARLRY